MIQHAGLAFPPPVFVILYYLTYIIGIHYILSLASTAI